MNKYKIIFDNGKPFEVLCYNDKDLKKALKDFYIINKNNDFQYTAKVYNANDEDISESQYIDMIITNIIFKYNE